MRRMEDAKAFKKQTGQRRILNYSTQIKRRCYELSQTLEEAAPNLTGSKDGFYDGLKQFVIGSKENVTDFMKFRYYARDYVDLT